MARYPRVRLDYSPHPLRIYRNAALAKLLGVDQATIWRWWKVDKTLPPPIELSPGVKGWREDTIKAWLDERQEVGHV